jgi:hypothetical protein
MAASNCQMVTRDEPKTLGHSERCNDREQAARYLVNLTDRRLGTW